jgi:hypothetical protein
MFCGAVVWVVVAVSLVLATVNLFLWRSIPVFSLVASILWLVFVAFMIRSAIRNAGSIRQFVIEAVSVLARKQFVVAVNRPQGLAICFCYEFCGRRYHVVEIPAESIESLDWSQGQASSLAGRDMDDWQVYLWYHPRDRRHPLFPGMRTADPHVVGPPRAREFTDRFGHEFRLFLKSVGIQLNHTKNETEFWRVAPDQSQAAAPMSELT